MHRIYRGLLDSVRVHFVSVLFSISFRLHENEKKKQQQQKQHQQNVKNKIIISK